MGLAFVEFIIDIEQRFGIDIPDAVAGRLRTPRHLIDHVCTLVQAADDEKCVSQQSFYVARRALMDAVEVPKREIRAATPLESILPESRRGTLWPKLARKLGVRIRLRRPAWMTWAIGSAAATAFIATITVTRDHRVIAATVVAAAVGMTGLVASGAPPRDGRRTRSRCDPLLGREEERSRW